MKHILFISHSILDFNLMTLVCESLPLKTHIIHLNPDNPVILKKRLVDLIILDHDTKEKSGKPVSDFFKVASQFDGPLINFSEETNKSGNQKFYQKPFNEEDIKELILNYLKKKKNS
ncbi:MAG: hypothetical protein ACD_73C00161G0001 [uncultured bacterium]|nr:MAG: hypothetical protein ACD_73C00161G0001 [uncultured bacterium]